LHGMQEVTGSNPVFSTKNLFNPPSQGFFCNHFGCFSG